MAVSTPRAMGIVTAGSLLEMTSDAPKADWKREDRTRRAKVCDEDAQERSPRFSSL